MYSVSLVTAGNCEPFISDLAVLIKSKPKFVFPIDSSTNKTIAPTLKWSFFNPNGDNIKYNVFLDSIDGSTLVSDDPTDTVYSPVILALNTTYYWKIIAKDTQDKEITGDIWSFKTANDTVSDIDGNIYPILTIGNQTWMTENLRTTKYNNGTAIPLVTDNTAWSNLQTPAYCWYNNDQATNSNTYGALYNWITVNTSNLCPSGWHVPSDSEWTELTDYLGGESVAGGKLKETGTTHWNSPNEGATNETGFTALPGGHRYCYGSFYLIGDNGSWWSATECYQGYDWYRDVDFGSSSVYRGSGNVRNGFSVRCVRD